MSIQAVFFDLDGTLLDTAPDLAKALNKLLVEEGKQTLPENVIRKVVSNGAYAMLKLAFGFDKDHPETAELRQRLLDFYSEDLSSDTCLFPGLENLLEQLATNNIAWGIATNKPAPYAEPLIEALSFPSRPTCVICPEHVTNRKPDPESLHLACKITQCSVDNSVYIGDHLRDIQCGKNANMRTIAVNYGYIDEGDSAYEWQADHVVENGEEIWPLIQNLMG